MGILDKVGDAIKKAGKFTYEKIKETKERHDLKMKLLKRFTPKQLKNLALQHGHNGWEEDFDGKRYRSNTSDFLHYASWNISFEDVKDFAVHNRIQIADIIREEKELERKRKPDQSVSSDEIMPLSRFKQVIEIIEQFEPSRTYRDEYGYHNELQGWLKAHFKDAIVEHQTGSSRPDIVIGDIAIEVKGPTRTRDLKTIADKCNRYLQYYSNLVVVLFEVDVNERYYHEWVNGINRHYSNVEIIRKD